MKIVWLCNFSPVYIRQHLDIEIDASSFHPTTWIHYMVEEIKNKKNIELHLITSSTALDKDYIIKEKNVTFYFFRIQPELPRIFLKGLNLINRLFPLYQIYTRNKIIKLVNKISPDIVNAHGTDSQYGMMLNYLNFPSIVWMQGMINFVIHQENTDRMKKRLQDENATLAKQKYYITFPGEMETEILKHNPAAKFYNICHPNSLYTFSLKMLTNLHDADIVFNGALVKRKGIEDLIEAIKIVQKILPNISAKFIGYPGDRKYLEDLKKNIITVGLEKNINFIGFLESHDEVLMEIKKSKIFVLPTHVDTGPRSVAEAMTIGVPVISSNIDGLRNMIQNRKSGILIDVGDVESLAEAIIELLNNAELRQKYAEEAYKFAIENYYPSNVIDKIISTYSDVINEYKGSAKKISIENFEVEKI